jgi:hypothetical protein
MACSTRVFKRWAVTGLIQGPFNDLIGQVTVEDPAPGCSMLRCVTDVQELREALNADEVWKHS